MRLDGLGADKQLLSDLFRRLAFEAQSEYLALAPGQLQEAPPLQRRERTLAAEVGAHIAFARGRRANGLHQLGGGMRLEDVAGGPFPYRLGERQPVSEAGQNDDSRAKALS